VIADPPIVDWLNEHGVHVPDADTPHVTP
jgi:hypothetical protein